MSGLEAVGLVLGVVPLLISGLEHYAEGIRMIKTMWNYEAVVNHLVIEFTLAQGIFQHSCLQLLMPVLPDEQVQELLQGASLHWKDEALVQGLRKRLGPDYELYTRSIRVLYRQLKLFIRKLALDENTLLPPWMTTPTTANKDLRDRFFRLTWQRVKLGFDKPAIESLLNEIKSNVNQIDKFTRGSMAVAPKLKALDRRTNSKYWLKVRNHAKGLFEGLTYSWRCTCPHPHRASLRLEDRDAPSTTDEQDIKFGIQFSFDIDPAHQPSASLPWTWCQVVARTFQRDPDEPMPRVKSPVPSPEYGTRVSFQLPVIGRESSLQSTSKSRVTQEPEWSAITDFCRTLRDVQPHTSSLGYLDGGISRHQFSAMPGQEILGCDSEVLSFHDVLRRRGLFGFGPKERYALALNIASAVLQLHSSPWLTDQWSLNDIFFTQQRTPASAALAGRTYVSRSFLSQNATKTNTTTVDQTKSKTRTCVANETIFSLGVALIEISFGMPILSLKGADDPDIPGLTEFFIATRLVHDSVIKERDHDKYAEVVQRCVKGQLSVLSNPLSLEEAKVLQSFYDDVVMPLREINDSLHNVDSGADYATEESA